MTYDRTIHHRRSLRLHRYDYATNGVYFVTICAADRACIFGDIIDGEMHLNALDQVVHEEWTRTPTLRPGVTLDEFQIMPNHMHGLLVIGCNGLGTARRAPTTERFGKAVVGSLPTIVRAFKSATTRRINIVRGVRGARVWQVNYFERVIRDDRELNDTRTYVQTNPLHWPSEP